jgi:hypothetical protein
MVACAYAGVGERPWQLPWTSLNEHSEPDIVYYWSPPSLVVLNGLSQRSDVRSTALAPAQIRGVSA